MLVLISGSILRNLFLFHNIGFSLVTFEHCCYTMLSPFFEQSKIILLSEATIQSIFYVCITGERSIFCLNEFGKVKFSKKLEYSGRCMKVNRQSVDTVNYMVATNTNTLMLYSDTTLKWASQLNHTPVQIDYCSMK